MRYHDYLRQRYRHILGDIGAIWVIIGLLILSPLLALPFYWSESALAPAFLWPGLALILLGLTLRLRLPRDDEFSLTVPEGAVIVVLTWVVAIVVGATPFMLSLGLTFTQAVFEATSGWTTTGLSVIDVEAVSPILLLYRSIIQLAGGAGFAIIMLAALTGPAGMGLSSAEGREEQLEPNVRHSASLVLRLYFAYVVFGVLALRIAGMNWFDAINHAFAALSTGGFSTHAASIGYWDSAPVEIVTIVLMLLGTINFLVAYAVVRGRWSALWRTSEVQFLAFLLAVSIPTLLFGVTLNLYPTLGKALRVAVFEVVTAISTCGFATVSYVPWSAIGWLFLIGLMMVGGGSGSTAGGIKQVRIVVMMKGLLAEIRRPLLPPTAVCEPSLWQAGQRRFLQDRHIRGVALFVFLYALVFAFGSGVITASGYSLREGMFEFASSLSTIGLSVGVTTPDAPFSVLWVETLGMFLGRLEFFAVITGVAKFLSDGRVLLFERAK